MGNIQSSILSVLKTGIAGKELKEHNEQIKVAKTEKANKEFDETIKQSITESQKSSEQTEKVLNNIYKQKRQEAQKRVDEQLDSINETIKAIENKKKEISDINNVDSNDLFKATKLLGGK